MTELISEIKRREQMAKAHIDYKKLLTQKHKGWKLEKSLIARSPVWRTKANGKTIRINPVFGKNAKTGTFWIDTGFFGNTIIDREGLKPMDFIKELNDALKNKDKVVKLAKLKGFV